MSAAVDPRPPAGSGRVMSVDLLRGLDVLLMLFVNEMAGVAGAPAFLLHAPRDADGMTVTDVVFPAFLFIIGVAVPFALGRRLERGEALREVWRHVLTRTLALLVMGVFMVNAERDGAGGVLSRPLWTVLMAVGLVLVWGVRGEGSRRVSALRAGGVALLAALALLYRAPGVTGLVQMRPLWWGILGLLGWSYLVAAGLYLVARDRAAVLVGAVALLYCLYLADEVGGAGWLALPAGFDVGRTVASHAAIAVSGVVLGVLLRRGSSERPRLGLVWQALGYAAALAAAGVLLHSLRGLHTGFWVNKGWATPPWCLFSSAWTAGAWAVLYAVVDVKGWRRWPRAVSLAGENALMAYVVPYVLLSLFALSTPLAGGANPYEVLGRVTWVGFLRAALFAWIVVALCGWMRRRGVRMQL